MSRHFFKGIFKRTIALFSPPLPEAYLPFELLCRVIHFASAYPPALEALRNTSKAMRMEATRYKYRSLDFFDYAQRRGFMEMYDGIDPYSTNFKNAYVTFRVILDPTITDPETGLATELDADYTRLLGILAERNTVTHVVLTSEQPWSWIHHSSIAHFLEGSKNIQKVTLVNCILFPNVMDALSSTNHMDFLSCTTQTHPSDGLEIERHIVRQIASPRSLLLDVENFQPSSSECFPLRIASFFNLQSLTHLILRSTMWCRMELGLEEVLQEAISLEIIEFDFSREYNEYKLHLETIAKQLTPLTHIYPAREMSLVFITTTSGGGIYLLRSIESLLEKNPRISVHLVVLKSNGIEDAVMIQNMAICFDLASPSISPTRLVIDLYSSEFTDVNGQPLPCEHITPLAWRLFNAMSLVGSLMWHSPCIFATLVIPSRSHGWVDSAELAIIPRLKQRASLVAESLRCALNRALPLGYQSQVVARDPWLVQPCGDWGCTWRWSHLFQTDPWSPGDSSTTPELFPLSTYSWVDASHRFRGDLRRIALLIERCTRNDIPQSRMTFFRRRLQSSDGLRFIEILEGSFSTWYTQEFSKSYEDCEDIFHCSPSCELGGTIL